LGTSSANDGAVSAQADGYWLEEDDEDDEVEAEELYTVHESFVLGRRGRCYGY